MSNQLAVATVTATLYQHLAEALTEVAGADITFGRPDKSAPDKGINLYLYEVDHRGSLRFTDLPTRNSRGDLVEKPRAPLELRYLLSFYGEESSLEPQRLLGAAVRVLNGKPVLTRAEIRAAIANPSFSSFLAKSDLADEVDLVKFTPLSMSMEETSKLWSTLLKADHVLSLAYSAGVVFIEGEGMPRTALPVRIPQIQVLPWQPPRIDTISPQIVVFSAGASVSLQGSGLLLPGSTAQIGRLSVTPNADSTASRLNLTVTPLWRAGVQMVQVIQPIEFPAPPGGPVAHSGFESNTVPLILQPTLTGLGFDAADPLGPSLVAACGPDVEPTQKVELLLNEKTVGAQPRAFRIAARQRTTTTGSLRFEAASLPAGLYLGRLRVDGAESRLSGSPAEEVTLP
jgi:Pvc16 N-terminal domain